MGWSQPTWELSVLVERPAGTKVLQGETNIVFEGLGSNKLGDEQVYFFKNIFKNFGIPSHLQKNYKDNFVTHPASSLLISLPGRGTFFQLLHEHPLFFCSRIQCRVSLNHHMISVTSELQPFQSFLVFHNFDS